MEELAKFGMKNSLFLPSLANKYFDKLRAENHEPIYTYNDEFYEMVCKTKHKRRQMRGLKPKLQI